MSRSATILVSALASAVISFPAAAQTEQSASTSSGQSARSLNSRRASSKQQAADRIEAILRQPLTAPLDFVERPLNQALAIISEEYELPIVIDTAALDALAISPDTEVTVNVRNMSLDSALQHILRSPALEDVTFIVKDEVLLITNQEEADAQIEVRVYRVDDLVREPATGELDFDSLIELIVESVAYDSWQANGSGEGSIKPLRPGILVVAQTRRVHQQLTELLVELRSVASQIKSDESTADAARNAQPVTRAIRTQRLGGDEEGRVRDAVVATIHRSVDWQRHDGLGGEKPYLAILPDRVIVRHLPSVIAQVERLIDDLGLAPPRPMDFGGGQRGGGRRGRGVGLGGGGGF